MDDIDRTFDWYNAALRGIRGPINPNEPMSGFYRSKARDGTLSAVAFWYDTHDGAVRCQQNGKDVNELRAVEIWPFASRYPIREEVFWTFRETGVWTDIDETAQKSVVTEIKFTDFGAIEVKDEVPPEVHLARRLAELKQAVGQYLKLESDEQASRAQSLRSSLTGLKGDAKKQYDALNRPLLDEQKRIRGVWNPIMEAADAAALQLRTALEDWELSKRKAAQAAEQTGTKPNMPAPSAKISGGMGRAASAKPYMMVVDIDVEAVFQQFKEHAVLRDLLVNLAQEAINSGIPVPGAKTEERIKIR